MKTAGVIYYTDNHLREPIMSIAQKYISDSGLPIVSCSLKPINFGKNIVLEGRVRSYPTMCQQILTCLENIDTDYVYFCEHDVLYAKSYFDFVPERDDVYYYNVNVWRWWYGYDKAISYDDMVSLSQMCCNRELAIKHYKLRLKLIDEQGLEKERGREPRWARRFGYEPGSKKRRNGGVSDEDHERIKNEFPNIDIRHRGTFSAPKITLESFKHPPTNWREWKIEDIPGWDLIKLFNLNEPLNTDAGTLGNIPQVYNVRHFIEY